MFNWRSFWSKFHLPAFNRADWKQPHRSWLLLLLYMENASALLQLPLSGPCLTLVCQRSAEPHGSQFTTKKVLVSTAENWSCQGLISPVRTSAWGWGVYAQPKSGTSIVETLHKTLNLEIHNRIARVDLAHGVSLALGTIHHHITQKNNPEHTI